MKNYIYIIILLLLMCGCGKTVYLPVDVKHTITYRDTLIMIKDTVMLDIPLEIATDTTSNDTSVLSTTFAQSTAYVSNGKIYHTLKQEGKAKVEVDTIVKLEKITEYIEKPIIAEKFVPTPYIPTIYKVGLWFSIAGLLLLLLKFIQNLKGGI